MEIKHQNVLFQSVRRLIDEARGQVVRNVNTIMLHTYFYIGEMIVEEEQRGAERAGYAETILKSLSAELTKEYGRGYSHRNLDYFKKFYLTYRLRISQSVIAKSNGQKLKDSTKLFEEKFKISWTHYVQLLKIDNHPERDFYEIESAAGNWSVRELQRQYQSSLYERVALSRDKDGILKLSQTGQLIERPIDTLKTPLILEFLDLEEDNRYSESDLETAIINKLEAFMMELGKGFLFEGRQRRLTLDGDHFYVDLVFYNRLLGCFVLIDLKIGKLTHQDIGQMQMYVNYYDRRIKQPQEKPTLGIVLCKEDNKAVVEFTLPLNNEQIFSKEYKLYLPSKEDLRKQLE